MYTNIGQKIMTLAKVIAFLGIVFSLIIGLIMIEIIHKPAYLGIIVIIFGSLGSWIGSFLLYGFGQLVQDTANIARRP